MQILALVLYSHTGRQRVLQLDPGRVNIVTGRSRTGKSQLIPIVDYVLGRSTIRVARGPIRNTVAWYALLLAFSDTQMFIARKSPDPGYKSSTATYLLEGANLKIPDAILEQNSNISELETAINARLGISANLNIPAPNRTSPPLSANFRHALFYSFQSQREIADPDVMFHRQAEGASINLALRDTLPYFLGVVREDALSIQQNLRRLQHQLLTAKRAHREAEELRGNPTDGLRKAFNLLSEARQLGLVPGDFNESLNNLDQLTDLFRNIAEWTPGQAVRGDSRRLTRLINERERLSEQRELLSENIETLKTYALDAEGYIPVAREQALRLESIGFFESIDHNPLACPACGQAMEHPTPSLLRLGERLDDLNRQLDTVARSQPQMRRQIEGLENQQAEIDERVRNLYDEIQTLYAQEDALKRLKDEDYARVRLTGRISLWLESVSAQPDLNTLEEQIRTLEYQVNQIEEALSASNSLEKLSRAMISIGTQMTRWAADLALEPMEEGAFVDLDPVRMSLLINTVRERITLSEIGSGENWLGYHLVVHFALHSHFVRQKRPTPRFIFLDQPTQVYFPESSAAQEQIKESGELGGDWRSVQQMFHFIFRIVEQLSPEFQVIISDHANLQADALFQSAVKAVWRDGNALIPSEWIEEWNESHSEDAPEESEEDQGESQSS